MKKAKIMWNLESLEMIRLFRQLRPLSLGNRLFIMSNNEVELARLAAEAQKVSFIRIKKSKKFSASWRPRGNNLWQDHCQGDPGWRIVWGWCRPCFPWYQCPSTNSLFGHSKSTHPNAWEGNKNIGLEIYCRFFRGYLFF